MFDQAEQARLIEFLHDSLDGDIASLAQSAGMNVPDFQAVLVSTLRITPYRFVLSRRIEQVKGSCPRPRGQNRYQCGGRVSTPTHFTITFKRRIGKPSGRAQSGDGAIRPFQSRFGRLGTSVTEQSRCSGRFEPLLMTNQRLVRFRVHESDDLVSHG